MQAIKDQADCLDQVIFAGFTHEPAEKLARRLVAVTPPELEYVFFSDSGSTSVEVALKMALGFWRHQGEKRTGILALEGAYHGDTVGGMSVGERGVFNAPYDPLLFDVERLPFPFAGREEATLEALDVACGKGKAAALIVEPLILGAGGMLIYGPEILSEMKRICEMHASCSLPTR
jgi:adenosylmethionine---8-amino-7-oxononanoate aminotransferase